MIDSEIYYRHLVIIRLRGKLIEQSEAGKCLVIGTIMADCLIIKQQKIL